MGEHPIENLMITAMNSIQNMVDVNTIVGEPIQSMNGITIIPISKVSFGFAAGGSEFTGETIKQYRMKELKFELSYLYNRIIRKMKKLITGEGVI